MQFCPQINCVFLIRLAGVLGLIHSGLNSGEAAEIRDRAVLSLSFDELSAGPASGAVAETAKSGAANDAVTIPAGATAIASSFVPGSTGRSLLLDSTKGQYLSVANSDDISRSDAVTVSGFFASLHALSDNTFHGLFAKRQPDGPGKTNYGINYNPSTDNFQVYVNDGTGYKVAAFSVKAAVNFRKRIHLIAAFDNGDAPGADADTDADDLRLRLFINGNPVAPTSVPGGIVDGVNGWLQDVTLSKCQLDTPLTFGGSFAGGELTHLIVDDLHVFAESLNEADAKALFQEVAGTAADSILKEQTAPAADDATAPRIGRLSPIGLSIGKSNRLIVRGRNLEGATLRIGGTGLVATAGEGSNANQAVFQIDVPANAAPGRYLLQIVTANGVSNGEIVCLDSLTQHEDGAFPEAKPATELPIAVSGVIADTEQKRVYFTGTAGQRVVAEVEARRIGSRLDPVVEIKSAVGAPLAIQWQQSELAGDTRAIATLSADGLYFVELHDLQFRAPANSTWRLLLGDLPPSAAAFPPTLTAAPGPVRTVGGDLVSESVSLNNSGGRLVVESGTAILPLPPLRTEAGTEVTEPIEGTFDAKPLDATFVTAPFAPLFVNGRISAAGETDQFTLTVTPGQALHFAVAAQSRSSALIAELAVLNGDAQIAFSNGDNGSVDPSFDVTVPEGVKELRVRIRDFTGRGSAASVYRLLVARKDRPAIVLTTNSDAIRLPSNGSVPVRISVIRQSPAYRYAGPIRLRPVGMAGVTITPGVIAASEQNQEVLLVVTRNVQAPSAGSGVPEVLMVEAQTEGLEVNVTSKLQVVSAGVPMGSLTLREDTVLAADSNAVPATILLDSVPPVILRGVNTTLPVRVLPLGPKQIAFMRFEMQTTETARKEDPNKPESPNKPLVAAAEFQFAAFSSDAFPLQITVPLDVAEPVIDAVIGVDFVDQPLALDRTSRAWTAPIRLSVEDAVVLTPAAAPAKGMKGAMASVSGLIRRHSQFAEAVTVSIDGLPKGYSASPATVAADAAEFSLAVTIPADAAGGEVPNLTVRCLRANGQPLTNPMAVKLVIE